MRIKRFISCSVLNSTQEEYVKFLIALGAQAEAQRVKDILLRSQTAADIRIAFSMQDVRAAVRGWQPDVAFVDPATMLGSGQFSGTRATDPLESMDDLSRTGLLKYLQCVNERMNFIFVADDFSFSALGMKLHVSGYVERPYEDSAIIDEMGRLRFEPAPEDASQDGEELGDAVVGYVSMDAPTLNTEEGLYVRAFGNFEVFYDGVPVAFRHGRTKELFAYLIDRNGSMVTNGELVSVLWDDDRDRQHASYLRTMKLDLEATFKKLGCSDVIMRGRGTIACVPANIQSDYFVFLKRNAASSPVADRQHDYRGEYMSQYGWAEFTKASLASMASAM